MEKGIGEGLNLLDEGLLVIVSEAMRFNRVDHPRLILGEGRESMAETGLVRYDRSLYVEGLIGAGIQPEADPSTLDSKAS